MHGFLGVPFGATYNATKSPKLARMDGWHLPPVAPRDWANAPRITVQVDQSWSTGTFSITGHDAGAHYLNMSWDGNLPSGGFQGGRAYHTRDDDGKSPLIAGGWYVSNVREELDAPGEYFYDPVSHVLTVFYNSTPGTPPPADWGLVVPTLEVFFNLSGTPAAPVTDVSFIGLGFRDQLCALLLPWGVPSGGDWALRAAGALHLRGTERVTLQGGAFWRTDSNAVFLSGYNRNATVVENEFAWIGFSAVASWGDSVYEDATGGEQPWGTVLAGNVFRELGVFEKQSSAYFLSKSPLSRVEGNLMYNGPRAMVNFNDNNAGGGSVLTRNLVFNTCRVSGDHGPYNSWSRMPLASRVATGGGAGTFASALTVVSNSMIVANYGGSQGFDNDDGSEYYRTVDNFFYQACGFKMDYGGHDSIFEVRRVGRRAHSMSRSFDQGLATGQTMQFVCMDAAGFRVLVAGCLLPRCYPGSRGSRRSRRRDRPPSLRDAADHPACRGVSFKDTG